MTGSRIPQIAAAAEERILVLDGAMGTMIQAEDLREKQYRGERFAQSAIDLKGNNDLLNLTQPDLIRRIHGLYLKAGADILKTNTFNATRIAQADYRLEDAVREINRAGARLARDVADSHAEAAGRPVFVAGVLGPTNRTASISPDVNDPGHRNVTFDELVAAYREATGALIDGGVDMILVETVFDTLNAKAAVFAVEEAFEAAGHNLPLMISGTITDLSGRTLSGQTVEAFDISLRHARPFAVGLNCALGPKELDRFLRNLADAAETRISVHPNAGLPNEFGGYDMSPDDMAAFAGQWAEAGLLNIIGGCCGTTPTHIEAIAEAVRGKPARAPRSPSRDLRLSGLEPFGLAA